MRLQGYRNAIADPVGYRGSDPPTSSMHHRKLAGIAFEYIKIIQTIWAGSGGSQGLVSGEGVIRT